MPPRLFYHEIRLGMPSSLDAFMAENATIWAMLGETSTSSYSFPDAVTAFANSDTSFLQDKQDFSSLFLFAILFGMLRRPQDVTGAG